MWTPGVSTGAWPAGYSGWRGAPPRMKTRARRRPLRALAAASAGASVVSTEPSADGASGAAPPALTSKSLGVERGKLLPPVPSERVHWVCDAEGVARMREAVMDPTMNPTTREGYPPVVGLDGEWKPGSRTPVSILQVATRTDAFVVDLFAVAPAASPACDAFDAFLGELLSSETVYKLGFSFGYDLSRMRASYPHLPSLRELHPRALVDVKQLAHVASANRMNLRVGLATLTRLVLGANLSKEQQCSDWSRRPLSAPQLAYAAADAYYLCLIFDKCVAKSNDTILGKRLDDVVAAGDPRAKGKHLPRKAKKALKKQAALAARLVQRAANGDRLIGHAQRVPETTDVTVDVPRALASVGALVKGGNRKGAVKLLAGDGDARASKRGGALERWANACAFYLSVGQPGKRGSGMFWEESPGGDVWMRPDANAFAAASAEDVSAFRRATTTSGTDGYDLLPGEDPEADEVCPVDDDDDEGVGGGAGGGVGGGDPPEALLFTRRPPGGYVFCGRLEGATRGRAGEDEDESAHIGELRLRLVDTAALRASSTFHQLVGCRLEEAPPER